MSPSTAVGAASVSSKAKLARGPNGAVSRRPGLVVTIIVVRLPPDDDEWDAATAFAFTQTEAARAQAIVERNTPAIPDPNQPAAGVGLGAVGCGDAGAGDGEGGGPADGAGAGAVAAGVTVTGVTTAGDAAREPKR